MIATGNRFRAAIERIVSKAIAAAIAYRTTYACVVVHQRDDGTLDVKPIGSSGTRLFPSGITNVPIRTLPGVAVQVADGALVQLAFEDGDPGAPVATLFDGTSLKSLTITATTKVHVTAPSIVLGDDASAAPIARVGDVVQVAIDTLAAAQLLAPPGTAGGPIQVPAGPVILSGQILSGANSSSAS